MQQRTCIRTSAADRLEYYTMRDPNSGCWLWTGSLFPNGYGQTSGGKGRVMGAHKLSYEIHRGAVPEGMMVCHKCDVKSCVNPAHLFLGYARDNSADMVAKSRQAAGSRHGSSKLTEADIPQIRGLMDMGFNDAAIARRYGVVAGAIHHIRHGNAWKHVA